MYRERHPVNMALAVIYFWRFSVKYAWFCYQRTHLLCDWFWISLPLEFSSPLHPWGRDSGELPYSVLEIVLSSLFASYSIMYTKGLEKNNFCKKTFWPKDFKNLNDFNCPKNWLLRRIKSKVSQSQILFLKRLCFSKSFYFRHVYKGEIKSNHRVRCCPTNHFGVEREKSKYHLLLTDSRTFKY